jgi:hypothetical protein
MEIGAPYPKSARRRPSGSVHHNDYNGQLYVQLRVQEPHLIEYRLVVHWLVVGQVLVTPSQVTELEPTEQVLMPEQLTVREDAEQ